MESVKRFSKRGAISDNEWIHAVQDFAATTGVRLSQNMLAAGQPLTWFLTHKPKALPDAIPNADSLSGSVDVGLKLYLCQSAKRTEVCSNSQVHEGAVIVYEACTYSGC
jgi:hypothetical protein